jgi:putative glutamine amidotransferase
MPAHRPLIGIACDVKEIGILHYHTVAQKYIDAAAHGAGGMPLLIPAQGAGCDLEALDSADYRAELLGRLDALLLPGSPANICPSHYEQHSVDDTPRDHQRDATTLPLIRAAVDAGLPFLAICRGCQEVNVALGGSLHQQVYAVPGKRDHREDPDQPREVQYGPAHPVALAENGLLQSLLGTRSAIVNSLHGQGIDRLAAPLAAEAWAPDGLIEAVRVKDSPTFQVAVQWHPEHRWREQPLSVALFKALGEAAAQRASNR